MLSDIFYWVLNMSIIGSVAGMIVLALRKIKVIGTFAAYVLWAIPLIRFWLPFGIASKYSLLSLISKFTTKTVIVWEEAPVFTATNSIMGAESYFPIEYKTDFLEKVFDTAAVIWIIICLASIIASVLLYMSTKSEINKAEHIKGNVYSSEKVSSPAVYGVLRPKIVIPSSINVECIGYIILHEETHVKRMDNLFRIIAVITACIHWFNPLSWIFLNSFFTDMEISCDSKVLKGLNRSQSKEYAKTILACASGKTFFASAFGGAKTKVRIEKILSFKKLALISSLSLGALLAVIFMIIITNAAV